MERMDVAIVGSGVIGMSIARGLLELDSSLRIAIFEKEKNFGIHASARNSGVLHAGFYYSPESMKARFCREGRDELEKLAQNYGILTKKIGKVVVTQNEEEEARLAVLLERGRANNVNLEQLPSRELARFEPLARTSGSFLWSPNTTISDPLQINKALRYELQQKNVTFVSGAEVKIINSQWVFNNQKIAAKHFVNAGGAWALDIAHNLGIGKDFRTMPFLGLYKQVRHSLLPLRTLVYPVPHPINPFLGVHLTLTVNGHVKIGPSALPIIGKSQYQFLAPVKTQELVSFIKNLVSLATGDKHNLWAMMKYEIPKLLTSNLVDAASKLVPTANQIESWDRKSPGIRGQLIDIRNGELVQDFKIENTANSTHILNAVSPGWTSSIPFGRHVSKIVVERFNLSS